MDRRRFLLTSGALGCSLAASPLIAPVSLAAVPGETRLVVIVLRGAMDGLDVVQPWGDPDFAALRPRIGTGEAAGIADLDGFFGLHPGLAPLLPLWQAGQLGFIHAVSTPYRDKRSHFDGQDLLEEGAASTDQSLRDGWLNRFVGTLPGASLETAFAVGREEMLILKGEAPVSRWSPEARLSLSPAAARLIAMVQEGDPLFEQASAEAIALAQGLAGLDSDEAAVEAAMAGSALSGDHVTLAEFVAERLRGESRIASFSLSGWDTHGNQKPAIGRVLGRLAQSLETLWRGLGPVWDKTAVVCITEFGRTAHENGSGGTDHGTGGAMILAGGALRGRRVVTDWPGLSELDLYAGRDLMPTRDLRAHLGWILRGLFGSDATLVESVVFPGVELGADPGHVG